MLTLALLALAAPLPFPRAAPPPAPPSLWAVTHMRYGASTFRAAFQPGGRYESCLPDGSCHFAGTWRLDGRRLTVEESLAGEADACRLTWSVTLDAAMAGTLPGGSRLKLLLREE